MDRAFEEKGLCPDIVLEAIDADVIKTYVDVGLGIGIIAGVAYEPLRAGRVLVHGVSDDVLLVHGEAQASDEGPHAGLVWPAPGGAEIKSRGARAVGGGEQPPAHAIAGLEHEDLQPSVPQPVGEREASDARPDDDHVLSAAHVRTRWVATCSAPWAAERIACGGSHVHTERCIVGDTNLPPVDFGGRDPPPGGV